MCISMTTMQTEKIFRINQLNEKCCNRRNVCCSISFIKKVKMFGCMYIISYLCRRYS